MSAYDYMKGSSFPFATARNVVTCKYHPAPTFFCVHVCAGLFMFCLLSY